MESFLDRFSPARVKDGAYAAESDVMLFVHIPKTAGVSVGRSLQDAYDVFRGVEWQNAGKSFREQTRQAAYIQSTQKKRQVIMGHYGWPELQVWRNNEMPMTCGAILRDPVARAISNYNYNCSDAHPANQQFQERFPTLDAYVHSLGYDVQITQMMGMVNSFSNVLEKLVRYYTYLGITERLDQSLQHFSRSHGLPALREHRKNVGRPRSDDEIKPALQKKIESRSLNDLRLHRLLLRIYEDCAR